jgi:hypothetical protein
MYNERIFLIWFDLIAIPNSNSLLTIVGPTGGIDTRYTSIVWDKTTYYINMKIIQKHNICETILSRETVINFHSHISFTAFLPTNYTGVSCTYAPCGPYYG